MSSRFMLIFASLSGFVFVALGAFASHVLNKSLGPVELEWLKTGLRYQAIHTVVLMVLGVAMRQRTTIWFYWSGVFLALGIVLFSGSLYCLALSHLRLWVYITPIGGISFLSGWLLMLTGALRLKSRGNV